MTHLHILTVRRNAALGRLATLQKRADKLPQAGAPVLKAALKELGDALDALLVANEQLQRGLDELTAARRHVRESRSQIEELLEVMPLPCVWTNTEGQIEESNPAAAALLNVSSAHLQGRRLVLFTVEREKFTQALAAMGETRTPVTIAVTVKPRERRARRISLTGRKFESSPRVCWFFAQAAEEGRVAEPRLDLPASMDA